MKTSTPNFESKQPQRRADVCACMCGNEHVGSGKELNFESVISEVPTARQQTAADTRESSNISSIKERTLQLPAQPPPTAATTIT